MRAARPFIQRANRLGGVYLYPLHNPRFIDELKAMIPMEERNYEAMYQRWYVSGAMADEASKLFLHYWPAANVFSQETASQGSRKTWGAQATLTIASSPYSILQVTAEACPEVIRAAYKALALKYHPDKGGDPSEMLRINEAMESLRKAGRV